ncbi:MAG: tetrathionate reductase family octaheme c-type cytochrome [Gammaproteobacteria bacterium]|nr:tetrathionate reductase family octaheme c-type cytochrome [Gammaproteobacteria bacterium]
MFESIERTWDWAGKGKIFLALLTMGWLVAEPAPAVSGPDSGSTADHTKFKQLNVKFKSGPEVTRACLECHTKAAKQIHQTKHWQWSYTNPVTGQRLGKRYVINNFCIAAMPNIASCSSCHIGYGWKDDTFDFTSEENVDCLVCHDTTGQYSKKVLRNPGKRRPRLEKFAQNVGPTSRRSCGACHFAGGGAKAVKHGDIDPTLVHPDFFVDVHMDADGLDFSCSTCHTSDQHEVRGSRYTPNAVDDHGVDIPGKSDGSRATCRSCHGDTPHQHDAKLNDHMDKIACQTCHIPEFSRGNYGSKIWWDWSAAGRLKPDGTPLTEEDERGFETYSSKKGAFRWGKRVAPEYRWFSGTIRYTLLGETVNPGGIVPINTFLGDPASDGLRIWPVKVMRGKQPYDTGLNTLAAPLTTGKDGYWKTFDWDRAITLGMQAVNLPYSGKYGFVETEMLWPITHMVAPADEALACDACHSQGGRLATISELYIPGRDTNPWVERIGLLLVSLTGAGVAVHALLRLLLRKKDTAAAVKEKTRVYMFKRFERFWHWAQGLLIMVMLVTGFEIHGTYTLLGFEEAVWWHTTTAWTLIGLWAFAIFWHFTTGEWRQYIPTRERFMSIARYYSADIFRNRPHPFKPTPSRKLNPLQRIAYLFFVLLLAPAIWITGLLYLYYSLWGEWGLTWLDLGTVAAIHVLVAYLLAVFFVGHAYMTTMGHSLWGHIKAMITGWEELD